MKPVSVGLSRPVMRIAVALASVLACTSPAAAQPGYHCEYRRQGDYGSLSADFEVPREGPASTPAYLTWAAPGGTYPAPRVTAAFYRMADGRYRIENGYAAIGWHVPRAGRGTRTLSLLLRSRPEAPRYARGALASDFERTGGPVNIGVDWSDMIAFARGARELHLVVIDRELRLVATTPVDRTLFERAEPHIIAALGELERLIANPGGTCEFLEDLRSNDVVVTSAR